MDYPTTHTSLSPIRGGFALGFVNYKKGCTRLAAASDKAYQLLAHVLWFSPASSTTKTGRHDIVEILLKVALNTKNQIPVYYQSFYWLIDWLVFNANISSISAISWRSKFLKASCDECTCTTVAMFYYNSIITIKLLKGIFW